jgi:hypothetical protein
MSKVSKADQGEHFTSGRAATEAVIVDELPSADELRLGLDKPGMGAPMAKLLAALADASRAGRVLLLVSVPGRDRAGMESLIGSMLPDRPPAVPSQAAVLQARRNAEARIELLEEFGYFTAEQVAEGRSRASNRSALAGRWRREGRIFAVDWKGSILYPGFQFDEQRAPRPPIRQVLAALPRDRMSDWEVALWWTAANGWLSGARPVDRLDDADPHAIVDAAARLAEPSPL